MSLGWLVSRQPSQGTCVGLISSHFLDPAGRSALWGWKSEIRRSLPLPCPSLRHLCLPGPILGRGLFRGKEGELLGFSSLFIGNTCKEIHIQKGAQIVTVQLRFSQSEHSRVNTQIKTQNSTSLS